MNESKASKNLQKIIEDKPLLKDYCKKQGISQAKVVSLAGFNGRCPAVHAHKHVHFNSLGECFLVSDLRIFL